MHGSGRLTPRLAWVPYTATSICCIKVSIPGGSDRFDHTLQNHAHAVCTVCGTVSDVLPQALPLLEEFLQQDCGFTVRRMNLVLEGVCPRCRQHTVS